MGTFTDPGFTAGATSETFTASVDWGDGTTQAVTPSVTNGSPGVLTTGSAAGTHTYAAAGTYTVSLTVADDDGGSRTATFQVVVAGRAGAKFYVVDQSVHATFHYGATGAAQGSTAAEAGNSQPRGIAANAAGTTLWVVDASKDVFVYTSAGVLQGSWAVGGVNQPQDIATDGTHVGIVDDSKNRVQFFANAPAG